VGDPGSCAAQVDVVPHLAARARVTSRGFEAEFRAVFDARYEELYRLIDRYAGDAALAADATQEAFVRLYQRGALPDDVRAWLASVALNLARDERRRVARRLRLIGRRGPDETMGDAAPAPDERVLAHERGALVRRALDTLPARDRALLLLRQEGFSYRELANALGIAEPSVGTLLARAKSAFRAAFERSNPITPDGRRDGAT